ncbi:hypothetical protein ACLM5H_00015 [Fredinandcohnia humi]
MNNKKRVNDRFESDVDRELIDFEEEIGFMLDEFDVEYPSESQIMMTIDAIRPYVPVKQNKWKTAFEKVSGILKHSIKEVFYITPLFWIANILFLLIGLVVVILSEVSPYHVMLLLAPIPTLTGIIEVVKSKDTGMVELEMSLKFNFQELILSKMVIISGFNFLLHIAFIGSISAFYPNIWIWKMILYWITPFMVISAISLVMVARFMHAFTVTGALVSWILIGSFISQRNVMMTLEALPVGLYIILTVFAAVFAIIKIIQIYKRGITYEFNH